jgi:DNA-binding XRE family transcriptional regulator
LVYPFIEENFSLFTITYTTSYTPTMTPPNPIKTIRSEAHKTQHEYASIAGVTEQVVMKTEQGLYPNIPPSILRVAAMLAGQRAYAIEEEYEAWIQEELRHVKLPPSVGRTNQIPKTPAEFIKWRKAVCELNDEPNSVVALAKLLKINPYVIQKFEAGRMKQTPMQIAERVAFIRGDF